jgi:hypothetical protein
MCQFILGWLYSKATDVKARDGVVNENLDGFGCIFKEGV